MIKYELSMIKYEGKWIDLFNVSIYDGNDHLSAKGKILLETPMINYYMDKEQFKEFKRKINEMEI